MASLVLEDVVPPAHVVLPRLGCPCAAATWPSLTNTWWSQHRRGPGGYHALHPKLAVRPWRPPGSETAPAPVGGGDAPPLGARDAWGRHSRRAAPAYPRRGGEARDARENISRGCGGDEGGANAEGERSRANGSPVPRRPKRKFRKSVTLDSDKVANKRTGENVIAFSFSSRVWGRQEVQAHAYLWDWNAKIVVSDVDGMITKSDLRDTLPRWQRQGLNQVAHS